MGQQVLGNGVSFIWLVVMFLQLWAHVQTSQIVCIVYMCFLAHQLCFSKAFLFV